MGGAARFLYSRAMRAWILAILVVACGSDEDTANPPNEPPAPDEPEVPPPPEMPEPPPVPMGWSAQTAEGVTYAMPPDWNRVAHISEAMVFSWQGPDSPAGRI